jgi:hypothetical protein
MPPSLLFEFDRITYSFSLRLFSLCHLRYAENLRRNSDWAVRVEIWEP